MILKILLTLSILASLACTAAHAASTPAIVPMVQPNGQLDPKFVQDLQTTCQDYSYSDPTTGSNSSDGLVDENSTNPLLGTPIGDRIYQDYMSQTVWKGHLGFIDGTQYFMQHNPASQTYVQNCLHGDPRTVARFYMDLERLEVDAKGMAITGQYFSFAALFEVTDALELPALLEKLPAVAQTAMKWFTGIGVVALIGTTGEQVYHAVKVAKNPDADIDEAEQKMDTSEQKITGSAQVSQMRSEIQTDLESKLPKLELLLQNTKDPQRRKLIAIVIQKDQDALKSFQN